MSHRSVPPTDPDVDPFWKDAFRAPPPWRDRVNALGDRFRTLRSVAIIVVGVLAVAGLGWWLLRPGAAPIEAALPLAGTVAGDAPATPAGAGAGGTSAAVGSSSSTSTVEPVVVAQAAGAVGAPGVYTLPPGARVDDLVDAAGGLSKQADLDRVNLAAPVSDGERIWVPAKGERDVPEVIAGAGGSSGGTGGAGGAGDGGPAADAGPAAPVDLNRATATELDALPGVGPATSAAILAYREQNGPFSSVEDLLEVRGIGEAKLEQLRPLVRV